MGRSTFDGHSSSRCMKSPALLQTSVLRKSRNLLSLMSSLSLWRKVSTDKDPKFVLLDSGAPYFIIVPSAHQVCTRKLTRQLVPFFKELPG